MNLLINDTEELLDRENSNILQKETKSIIRNRTTEEIDNNRIRGVEKLLITIQHRKKKTQKYKLFEIIYIYGIFNLELKKGWTIRDGKLTL